MAAFDLCWQRFVQIVGVVGRGWDPVLVLSLPSLLLVGGNFGGVRLRCSVTVGDLSLG